MAVVLFFANLIDNASCLWQGMGVVDSGGLVAYDIRVLVKSGELRHDSSYGLEQDLSPLLREED